MPDYNNGKIYKIVNSEMPNLVYIGSTTQKLNIRLQGHKDKSNKCTSKALFEHGQPEIILLEDYPCETKTELEKRERYWIEGNQCVNTKIPCRTNKEYREDNKEKIIETSKVYRQDNKEKLNEYRKTYYQDNNEKIKENAKAYRLNNKEKINERHNINFECDCGGRYTHNNKAKHNKSKKHQAFILEI
jgi:hypothetical protein